MHSLRIAMTVDPELPVPPGQYGGIERVVDVLVRGLVANGHHVTLFANPHSTVQCELVPYPCTHSNGWSDTLKNAACVSASVAKGRFNLIHSHGRLAYLLPLMPLALPKLMSYGREISPRSVAWGARLSSGTLQFTGVSQKLIQNVRHLAPCHVVYNGIDAGQYLFQSEVKSDAPLAFLGRLEKIKGPHLAIEVAKRCGRRLIIAGNVAPEHQTYFDTEIQPHLDGDRVRYVGPVDDFQKNEMLGAAAALLMPILWEEPFGMVMAEALACGTPVIALARGAVPEVVNHGVSGFVCRDVDQMAAAVPRIGEIDRKACRKAFEEQFSGAVMVEEYLRVYESMLASQRRAA